MSGGPAPLPLQAPLDVEVTRARVEGRAVLARRTDGPGPSSSGLLIGPVGLAAAVGVTAWLGAHPSGAAAAGVAATVGCLVCARAWVRAERRTARVDVLVRNRFVPAADVPAEAPDAPAPAARPMTVTPPARRFAALRRLPGRSAAQTLLDRLGRGTTLLAAVVAGAFVLVTVSAVAVLAERPGVLTLLAPVGPLALLATHVRLLVVRATTPVVGTGLLARWADAALLRRDLRLRLTGTAAAPVLYLLAWHGLPGWWFTLAVVAAGLLLAVQVALLVGLNGDGDLLPRAAPAAPQPLAPVST